MDETPIRINRWLYPFSFLYGIGVYLRNKLFDWNMLKSISYDVPVIAIGNIAVGGTGKTPHTEFLVHLLLKEKYNVAVLSRGYKRKTKGFVLADNQSTARTIGDEPYQIKKKFPDITVAVDADRRRGIQHLIDREDTMTDIILLDDAFQHRYVEPGVNILLTDYHRLFCDDALLPAGRLREHAQRKSRANVVIVTKCPSTIKPIDFNIIAKRLRLYPYQHIYFSTFTYGNLIPLFPKAGGEGVKGFKGRKKRELASIEADENILLLTGIASPETMVEELRKYSKNIQQLTFADHRNFTKKDMKLISEQFDKMTGANKLLITTEKDATRLINNPLLPDALKEYIYTLPIKVEILQNQLDTFNQYILSYVRANKRNGIISKR